MLKFRMVREDRTVPHTVGGQTYMVSEPHEVKQLVQPRDLDQIIRNVLTVITVVVVLGALTWSTVAIGDLLSSMAPVWVSYLVAVVFDLTWVACMGAEWLMRYDRERATAPRVAGWLALGVSVAAITFHGSLETGEALIGAAGGVVSVLAKGLWMVNMMISARRLSDLDQQWYEKAASATDAQLALTVAQRKLLRVQARVQQERAALEEFRSQPHVLASEPFEQEAPAVEAGSHEPVVYIIRNGNRVKIGTTTNLKERVRHLSLRLSDVLLTLDGGPDKERELHGRFADQRIGTTEWFDFGPEIREFVQGPSVPESDATADDLEPRRDLTELVRGLRTQGLDEDEIKERVREQIPDVKADSLGKAVRRTRTA